MAIYLVQHGVSLPAEIDPERNLSEDGRAEVKQAAEQLRRRGVRVAKIYHSGKRRAQQTAHIIGNQINAPLIRSIAGMSPGDDAAAFANQIEDNAIYVGHLPHLNKLVNRLTTTKQRQTVVKFSNAGVVCVDLQQHHILWSTVPSQSVTPHNRELALHG